MSNGKINYGVGLDNSQLRVGAEESKQILHGIGQVAAQEGQNLDNAMRIDASPLQNDLQQVQEAARQATQILSDIGKSFDTDTVEEKITALETVIRNNEDVMRSMNLQLKDYEQTAKEAFANGDMGLLEAVTNDISEQVSEIQTLREETESYRSVLESLQYASDSPMTTPTSAPMLFSSQEDYEYAKQLREQIEELQNQISQFDGSDADLQQLRDSLATTQQQLSDCEDAASRAASNLGSELGGKAAEASSQLYELNAAVEKQKGVVEELQNAVNEAAAAYEAMKESGDTQGIDEALIKYQSLSENLKNASNELYNLQAAQTDASASWANVNAECERADSIMVKLLGGQEKYNAIMAQLPQPLQAAVSGISGMTGAAKAFIATPLGLVLSAIIIAVKTLTTWFNSSAEGQMAFAKISGYLSGVLGQLKEIVIAVGKAIYNAFSNPKQAIEDLWEAIKTNVVNRFKAVGEIAGSLGKILKAAFTLDADGIKKGLAEMTNGFLKFGTGVDNLTGKLGKWASGVHNAASAMSDISVQQRNLEVEVSEWQKEKAKLDKVKAEARTKMYDTNLSDNERKEALKAYKDAVQKQLEQEQKIADKRIDLQKRTMELTSNTIEDENKLRELEAARTQVDVTAQNELAMLQRRSNTIEKGGAGGGGGTGANNELERQRQAEQQAEKRRFEDLSALKEKNRQSEIDDMKNDSERKIAQINFDYEREKEAILKQQKKWEDEQKGSLSSEQKSAISDALANAEKKHNKDISEANKENLDNMLSDIFTYEQKRLQIEEEYSKKRKQLYTTDDKGKKKLKDGVQQGNVDILNEQEKKALSAVDEQFASKSDEYQAWCNAISSLSLKQLEAVLADAQKQLDAAKKNGTASENDVAIARAKVTKAQAQLSKAQAQNDVSPKKRSVKEWEDLYKTLNECEKEFESIGDAVGGVAGDIIKTAGSIMSSTLQMINGIVQLVNMSETGIEGTAKSASKAISTVEKASVILTIISAAMQIAMTIINLFNNDDKKQKEIEKLQNRINQLQWELDHQDALRLQQNSFNALLKVKQVMYDLRMEAVSLAKQTGNTFAAMLAFGTKISKQQDLLEKGAEQIALAYANIAYTADKALGENKYAGAKEQLENIAKQQILIQEQIDAENSKKKTDHSAIQDWENKIQELGEQAVSIINDMVEDIIGGSSTEIAEKLSDAFFDAFKNGEDYAKAWGDTVNEVVADVLKRMMVQKFLEEPLGQIFDRYKSKWFKDGKFMGIDTIINSMSAFADDLNGLYPMFSEGFQQIIDALPSSLKDYFIGESEAAREAANKGIATASQESVDELNGRMTAVQGHTYSISENTKLLLVNTGLILQSVLNIESNTDDLSRRMANVESGVKAVKDTVNEIALNGLKIK